METESIKWYHFHTLSTLPQTCILIAVENQTSEITYIPHVKIHSDVLRHWNKVERVSQMPTITHLFLILSSSSHSPSLTPTRKHSSRIVIIVHVCAPLPISMFRSRIPRTTLIHYSSDEAILITNSSSPLIIIPPPHLPHQHQSIHSP